MSIKLPFKLKKTHVHKWKQIGPVELMVINDFYPLIWEDWMAYYQCTDTTCNEMSFRPVQDLLDCTSKYAITEFIYIMRHGAKWGEENSFETTKQFSEDNHVSIQEAYYGSDRAGYNGF